MGFRYIKLLVLFLTVSVLILTKTLAQDNFTQNNYGMDVDFYLYPTPSDIFDVINKEKISFNKELLNPNDNEQNYILTKSKHLNLGVYMTDLAFCAFFKKRARSMEYVNTISSMSDDLLISLELKKKLHENLFENVENMDSVYRITTMHYYDLMRELEENNSLNIIYIITTGAYIETFYIALNLVDEYSVDNLLLQEIAKQKFTLYNLVKFSKYFKEDPNVAAVIKYQEEMIEIFNSFLVEEGTKRSFKITEKGKLKFTGGPKITMNKEQFEKLKKTVERIRAEIIN